MKTTSIISFVILVILTANYHTGSQWQQTALTNGDILSMSRSGQHIFAGRRVADVHYTTDNGASWQNTGVGTIVQCVSSSGNYVFAASQQFYIYRSTNLGLNWNQIPGAADGVRSVAISNNMVFAGFQNYGLTRSTNFGETWDHMPGISGSITALCINGSTIFAGKQGLYRSTNSGINWVQVLPLANFINSIVVSGNIVYAGSDFSGVYKSENDGLNWQSLGPNSTSVKSITFTGSSVFAGSSPGGVYFSGNGGTGWVQKNEGLGNTDVRSLLIKDDYIYAGTNGSGIFKRPLSDFLVSVAILSTEVPHYFSLEQNFPNPFNPSTKIRFSLPSSGKTELNVYDAQGRLIETIIQSELTSGTYEADFNASNLASGMYFYTLTAGDLSETKKMVLIK